VTTYTFRVLFLSQRNAARSMMAEALANTIGKGQIMAFSAGTHPARIIDPVTVELLNHAGIEPPDHEPRHVREFSAAESPPLDFIFTLSDSATGESPPAWPGHPITAHWRCSDPARFETEAERRLSLLRTRAELERRLRVFLNLPMSSLDRMSLQAQVEAIGGAEH
jgi:protein-tyrosine-phosphatase